MKAVIGTAGHIDHGKSALVRALSGIDTDRLPEERARGISIELGFAHLDLPGGERAGIVDVPGHERFIRHMLAGAHGFDLVILVVAADDGVMPQTEEHFEIVHLLGVKRVVFAITKIDVADAARVAEVRDEIEILCAGTPSEQAPVVELSAIGGQGVEELRELLISMLAGLSHEQDSRPLRIPVDRVFVMKGHGTVVTGTALTGSVAPGDEVEILPRGERVRVRDVQVHGASVERAWAGQRVALNLGGIAKDGIARGDTVAVAQGDLRTERFNARVEIRPLAGRAVRSHERVRVYLATREILGRIVWLDDVSEVAPRSSAYAQIVLNETGVAGPGDRFVIRDETASRTLGGGSVLVSRARKPRRPDGRLTPLLEALESGDAVSQIHAFLKLAPGLGLPASEISSGLGLAGEDIAAALAHSEGLCALPGGSKALLVSLSTRYEAYMDAMVSAVADFHRRHPEQAGMDLEALRNSLEPPVDGKLFRGIIDDVEARSRLRRRGSTLMIPGHEVSMKSEDESEAERLYEVVSKAGSMPPTLKQLEEDLGLDSRRVALLTQVLSERGRLVKVSTELFFTAEVVSAMERTLRGFLAERGEISAAEFRDLITASRKYCIPLLDYFDRGGVTVRVGDVRKLRG